MSRYLNHFYINHNYISSLDIRECNVIHYIGNNILLFVIQNCMHYFIILLYNINFRINIKQ